MQIIRGWKKIWLARYLLLLIVINSYLQLKECIQNISDKCQSIPTHRSPNQLTPIPHPPKPITNVHVWNPPDFVFWWNPLIVGPPCYSAHKSGSKVRVFSQIWTQLQKSIYIRWVGTDSVPFVPFAAPCRFFCKSGVTYSPYGILLPTMAYQLTKVGRKWGCFPKVRPNFKNRFIFIGFENRICSSCPNWICVRILSDFSCPNWSV